MSDFAKIDEHLGRDDCRSAEDVWNTLNDRMKGGDPQYSRSDLMDIWGAIKEKSEILARRFEEQLTELLSQAGDIDEHHADDLLYRYKRALLRSRDIEYKALESRVQERVRFVREQSAFAKAKKAVEGYWIEAEAAQINDPGITPLALLPFYTKAQEEAERQLGFYQGSEQYSDAFKDQLQALIADAKKRRESLNSAEQSLTSGALIEDYVITLEHIRNISPGMRVPIYDMFGKSITENDTPEKAYEIYRERALKLARRKLTIYIDGGEGELGIVQLLTMGDPRQADTIYNRYMEKFGRLEQEFVPEIGESEERIKLIKLKIQIDVELKQLDAVEKEANAIYEEAESADERDKLIGLWNRHQANLKNYPLAKNSSLVVRDTESLLQKRTLMYLYSVADQIDVAIQNVDLATARKLIADNRTLLGLPAVKDEGIVSRIQDYATEIADTDDIIKQIRTKLDDLSRRAITDNTSNLMQELNALRRDFSVNLLEKEKDFADIEALIISRDNAKADIDRLKGYLHLEIPDMTLVKSQADHAIKMAKTNPLYAPIAGELNAFIEFRQALDLALDERVATLTKLAQSGRINDPIVRQSLDDALTDARDKQQRTQSNDTLLKEAKAALEGKQFDLVWEKLDGIHDFNDTQESTDWNKIFTEAAKKCPLDGVFDLNILNQLGDFQRTQLQEALPIRYQLLCDIQAIRTLEDSEAQTVRYKEIAKRLSGEDAKVVLGLEGEVRKIHFEAESNELLNTRPNGDDSKFGKWLEDLRESAKRGIELADKLRDLPQLALDYYLTSLRLDLLFIQNAKPTARPSSFTRIQETATKVHFIIENDKDKLTNPPSYNEKIMIRVATNIPQIVTTVQNMERFVTDTEEDIKRFQDSFLAVTVYLGKDADERHVLRDFASYYNTHLGHVYNTLRNLYYHPDNDRYTPKSFLLYVKMQILDPDVNREKNDFIQVTAIEDNINKQIATLMQKLHDDVKVNRDEIVKTLNTQIIDMQRFATIASSITSLSDLATKMRDTLAMVEKLRDNLTKFNTLTKTFEGRIADYPLNYGNLTSYSADIMTEFNQYSSAAKGHLEEMSKSHPQIMAIEAKCKSRISEFDIITEYWTQILQWASQAEFTQALQAIRNFEKLKEFDRFQDTALITSQIPSKIEAKTKTIEWTQGTVNGFSRLKTWLQEGDATIRRIREWRNRHRNIDEWLNPIPAPVTIIEPINKINSIFNEVVALQKKGKFQTALEELEQLLVLVSDDKLSQYANIPYNINPQDSATKFDDAIKLCAYSEGKALLAEAQSEYEYLRALQARTKQAKTDNNRLQGELKQLEKEFWEMMQVAKRKSRRQQAENLAELNKLMSKMLAISPDSIVVTRLQADLTELTKSS